MQFVRQVFLGGVMVFCGPLVAAYSSAELSGESGARDEVDRSASAGGAFEYRLQTEETARLDDRFPFGYWKVHRVYPVLMSEDQPRAVQVANKRIVERVHGYRCDGMGDVTFSTREVFIGNGVLSMTYDASWMCASMSSPQSESGFLNLDLMGGSEIQLEDQFRDAAAYEGFRAVAIVALNEELEGRTASDGRRCPPASSMSGFKVSGGELVVASFPGQGENSACDVEAALPLDSLDDELKPDSSLRL